MSRYWDLPLVGSILKKLNITNQEELANLNIGSLVEAGHVGPTKLAALLALVKTASDKRRKQSNVRAPSSFDLGYSEDLPVLEHLGVITARLRNVILSAKIETLGELAEWHRNVNVSQVSNYGQVTHRLVASLLTEISEKGVRYRVFQSDKVPENAAEFSAAFFANLRKDAEREVFQKYFVQEVTSQKIADSLNPPVSRQRVHQMIDTAIATFRDSWGPTATHLLEPLVMAFNNMDDTVPLDHAMSLVGASHRSDIELLSLVAQTPIYVPRSSTLRIASLGDREDHLKLVKKWSQTLHQVIAPGISREALHKMLNERGIYVPDSCLADWVEIFVNSNLGENPQSQEVYLNRIKVNHTLNQILREAGKPLNIHQILSGYEAKTGLTSNIRAVTSHMQRSEEICKYSNHQWVYVGNCGLTRPVLEQLAVECKKRVPRNGTAVNMRKLLAELSATHADAKNADPYVVRSAMIRLGSLRAWRAGCDVAWDTQDSHRVNISEHIADYIANADEPFSMGTMVEDISLQTGCLPTSVAVQVHSDELLQLGYDSYIHPLKVFKTADGLAKAQQSIRSAVPKECVVGVEYVNQAIRLTDSAFAAHVEQWGVDLIYAVARLDPTMQTRLAGRVLWHKDSVVSDVDYIYERYIKSYDGYFSPRQLAVDMKAVAGITVTHYINRVLRDLMERKLIVHVSMGNYRIVTWSDNQLTFGF